MVDAHLRHTGEQTPPLSATSGNGSLHHSGSGVPAVSAQRFQQASVAVGLKQKFKLCHTSEFGVLHFIIVVVPQHRGFLNPDEEVCYAGKVSMRKCPLIDDLTASLHGRDR